MSMRVRFWGVRGSVPSPGPDTAEVGGNTSCVQISRGDSSIILDGGTGLRALGDELSASGVPVEATILFSHVHWDHIQGVPFFTPMFMPESQISLYGRAEDMSLEQALRKQMTTPTFPVPFDRLPAVLSFHDVPIAPTAIGPFTVRSAALNHPNGVRAYRIETCGHSVVYATDTEHRADGRLDEALVELSRDADVLIYDAMYTEDQYEGRDGPSRKGWGHSTWAEGVRVARAAQVGQLVLFHHDPSHDDAAVAAIEAAAAAQLPGTIAAREGVDIEIDCKHERKAA